MHHVPAEPAPLRLAAGQSLLIEVAAGHEVRCLDGRLALSGAPRLLGDALASRAGCCCRARPGVPTARNG